ncbi:hypothetical protein KW786_01245 [Candidatus Parcubacteria bacterium]|nr:hypothetical protein [Candidatus Parcubacteria bacterium]
MQPDVDEVVWGLAQGASPTEFKIRGGSVLDLAYGVTKGEAALKRRQLMQSVFVQMAGLLKYFGPQVAHGYILTLMAWLRHHGQKRKDEILDSGT